MSPRERWTVYPLLFLSLGMAWRTRMNIDHGFESLRCDSLVITNKDGKPLALLGQQSNGHGQLEFVDEKGRVLIAAGVSADGKQGQFVIQSADGKPQVVVRSTPRGGGVVTLGANQKSRISLGYDDIVPGVLLIDAATEQRMSPQFFPVVIKQHPKQPETNAEPEPTKPSGTPSGETAPEAPASPTGATPETRGEEKAGGSVVTPDS